MKFNTLTIFLIILIRSLSVLANSINNFRDNCSDECDENLNIIQLILCYRKLIIEELFFSL